MFAAGEKPGVKRARCKWGVLVDGQSQGRALFTVEERLCLQRGLVVRERAASESFALCGEETKGLPASAAVTAATRRERRTVHVGW